VKEMRSTYVETIRRYCKEGFEWIKEYGIDKAIYATNRILRQWEIPETVTFIRLSTPKVDFYTNEAYSYAIGVESTGYPLAYISLQRLSLICHWGYFCRFPFPLPSKGIVLKDITLSLPFSISLPTALAAATLATHFPIRNWAGSIGISRREPECPLVASLLLLPEGSWKYEIWITFEKRRARCCLRRWGKTRYDTEVLHQLSGGYNKVVREVVRLAALLTL
jgi:hypothetical protein